MAKEAQQYELEKEQQKAAQVLRDRRMAEKIALQEATDLLQQGHTPSS